MVEHGRTIVVQMLTVGDRRAATGQQVREPMLSSF
jgi:hypothetical protein